MSALNRSADPRRLRAWILRAAGLTLVVLATAAPLPGDTPGCDPAAGIDDTPALLGDGPIRTFCGDRCIADCRRLVECGRYVDATGYSACVSECTGVSGRDCVHWTFESLVTELGDTGIPLCPASEFGLDRVITEAEVDRCLDEARTAPCEWCTGTENCWDPARPTPESCARGALCDPR